jgi:hypothetical protein
MALTIMLLVLAACTTTGQEPAATHTLAATPAVTHTPAAVIPTVTTPTEQAAIAVPTIQAFEAQLIQALERRDFAQIQGLMGETFMIAGWRSEGTAHAPDEAIMQLQTNYLDSNTNLVFDPNKDLKALLDGMNPLSILGPEVLQPSALFVSGWGMVGEDEAILYIAHRADESPYWYGVLFASGGFAPEISGETQTPSLLAIPEAGVAIAVPPDYVLLRNTELYRRGSFASYGLAPLAGFEYPYLAEIQFFNRESIQDFTNRCGSEAPCFFGDYPDVARYDGQKAALARLEDFESFSLQQLNERYFFVSQHACEGVPCVVREYATFVGDTKVDVWVMMVDGSQAAQADALFARLRLQDDWAGIGAMPGPLYTLVDPGLTLRYPLNWLVREEEAGDPDFVSHSVSFIPPTFANSDQPQVPAINLFIYRPPFDGALNEWLEAYSTDAPFGSEAGPETHFFGVGDLVEINGGSLLGLRFTHDVLGLTAHELLFVVGQTVVGLSYVEMGPEDLGPAFVQVQSSLAPANAVPSAEAAGANYVVALQDVAMYRGPATTFQQIGQVMDGQLALVTGASQDGGWWRVICPNDTIGDCWVSADPAAIQPTNRPGSTRWSEYRDVRYGYGLAVPCHWIVMPTPLEGDFATLTLRSYDEAFRAANSVKGWWKDNQWPDGAEKIDLTVVEDVPPDQALAEFVRELLLRNENTAIESLNDTVAGAYQAVSVVTVSTNNPLDKHTTIGFRMTPDQVLLVGVAPEQAWTSDDIQGILNSLVFSPEAQVVVPSYAPSAPIIAVPPGCGA